MKLKLLGGIGRRLLFWFLIISIVPIVVISVITYRSGYETMRKELFSELTLIARGLHGHILYLLKEGKHDVASLSSDKFLKNHLERINSREPGFEGLIEDSNKYLTTKNTSDPDFGEIFIINPEGKVVAASVGGMVGEDMSQDVCFMKGKDGIFVRDAYLGKYTGMELLAFSVPIVKEFGVQSSELSVKEDKFLTPNPELQTPNSLLGVMVITVKLSELNDITTGEGATNQKSAVEFPITHAGVVVSARGRGSVFSTGKTYYETNTPHSPASQDPGKVKDWLNTEVAGSKSLPRRGKTSEAYLVNKDKLMITKSRFIEDVFLKQVVDTESVEKALNEGKEMIGIYNDYRGIPVIGASKYISEMGWVLLVETDVSEAFINIERLRRDSIIIGGASALMVLLIAFFVSHGITNPIRSLVVGTERIAKGDLDFKIKSKLKDEIGVLSRSFDEMTRSLKRSRQELFEEKRRLDEVVSAIGAGLSLVDRDMKIVWVNKKQVEWFGNIREMVGAYCYKAYQRNNTICQGCSAIRTFRDGNIESCTQKWLTKDGRERWYHIISAPIKDEEGNVIQVAELVEDITEQKKAEEEIRYLSEYLETILESLDVYIRVVNPKCAVEYENLPLKKRFGDGVGKPCYLIWQKDRPCDICTSERAIEMNRVQRKEEISPGGQIYSLTSVPLKTRDDRWVAVEMIYDITRLKRSEYEIRYLASRILSVQEDERKRISRELHDETGQALTAIKINLKMIESNFTKDGHDAKKIIADTKKILTQIMKDIQRLSYDLRPPMIDDLGMIPALQSYAGRFAERTGINVVVKPALVTQRFPQEVEISLYRIIQEALTNVVKHSKAKNVIIELLEEGTALIVKVEDDGCGFDVDEVWKGRLNKGALGLIGIRERATSLRGNLEINTAHGKGTKLIISLPLARMQLNS